MRARNDWAEEHWDVIAMAASFAAALVIAFLLGVAYNVTGAWLDRPAASPAGAQAAPRVDDRPESRGTDADGLELGAE